MNIEKEIKFYTAMYKEFYDFVKNELIRNMSVMKALSEYYIENDHIVYMLVMSMQGSSEFHWPAQYVNFDSVVRYVKNANMHITNKRATTMVAYLYLRMGCLWCLEPLGCSPTHYPT